MPTKLFKNKSNISKEQEQMSTAVTDSSNEENENMVSFLEKENEDNFEIFGFKLIINKKIFCFFILFLFAIHALIANSNLFSQYTSNYLFYSRFSIEWIKAFLYNSRFKKQYIIFILLINVGQLNEMNELSYLQILFLLISNNFFLFFILFEERKFDQIIKENLLCQETLKSYKKIIKHIFPTQLIVLSEDNVLFANEECKKFNNCKKEKELFSKISSDYRVIIEDNQENNMFEYIKEINNLNTHSFYNFHARKVNLNTNENFYFEGKVQKINWQTKNSILILLHDRTPIKDLEKMKETNAYKDQLLANVSHDMRTPLHGIMNILEMSLERIYDDFLKKDLSIALKTSHLLLFMINDILDYSQINKGKLGLAYCKTKLHNIVDDVFNIMNLQANKKGLRLICNFPKEIRNFTLHTDSRRLQQILLNLLSNAIKFTIKGEVILSILVVQKAKIHFCVSDTGIGISDNAQAKLFNLYYKLQNDNINKEGIGLGLFICKQLLNSLCQSDIKVMSKLGIGSKFEFDVPFEEEKEEEEEEVDNINEEKVMGEFLNRRLEIYDSEKRKKKKGLYVLIVDDDQTSAFVMSKYLQSFGIRHKIVANGQKCLEIILKENNFSLIIMDLNMPIMGGLETTKKLRILEENKGLSKVPVLIVTADTQFTKNKLIEHQIDQCIFKPVGKCALKNTLEEIWNLQLSEMKFNEFI